MSGVSGVECVCVCVSGVSGVECVSAMSVSFGLYACLTNLLMRSREQSLEPWRGECLMQVVVSKQLNHVKGHEPRDRLAVEESPRLLHSFAQLSHTTLFHC